MSEPAAILATFSDFRLIKGRKQAQLVFEVPMEKAKEALDNLGMPDPAGGTWFAIVKTTLKDSGPLPTTNDTGPDKAEGGASKGEVAPPSPTLNSTRAVMLAKDPEFWGFVDHCGIAKPTTPEGAESAIKFMCQVQSKRELNERGKASEAFDRLRSQFFAWRQDRR